MGLPWSREVSCSGFLPRASPHCPQPFHLTRPREASCSGFLPESLSSLPPALPSYKGPRSPVQITPLPPQPAPSSEGEARLPDAQLSWRQLQPRGGYDRRRVSQGLRGRAGLRTNTPNLTLHCTDVSAPPRKARGTQAGPWNKDDGVGSNSSPCPSPGDLPNPGIESRSPALQVDYLPSEPLGKPKNTGVGILFLLQGNFSTQESNWGLLHYRQILYQRSYWEAHIYICFVWINLTKEVKDLQNENYKTDEINWRHKRKNVPCL